ncbi:MAG TPA: FKBP-type peptidyl-prolyl cis-trans isomerase, partial [Burkholderiaceae bacterium]|nr:FKBP-type peptidyl-prolyl cis-trans isomerase [Burkholderiaceae bacterium]
QPLSFELGVGQVIAGWDQGLVGMAVGGTRTLIIPSSLAYGATGSGPIPPNSPLVFTIQLLSVQ